MCYEENRPERGLEKIALLMNVLVWNLVLIRYYSGDQIRMRLVGHAAHMWDIRNAYRILVGMFEGKKPFWRKKRSWWDHIEMGHQE
jgi:hypothetical protein